MAQSKIVPAKNALISFLKSLPAKSSKFNVASFGTDFKFMFTESQNYDVNTLAKAINQVKAM